MQRHSEPGQLTRRSFLTVAALAWVHPRLSKEVEIVQFSDAGARLGKIRLPKVVKSDQEWRSQLSPLSYEITRRGGTERPFSGEYWNLHDGGLFRCICCDNALFSSRHKFDSGTGWPSFWEVVAKENVIRPPARNRLHSESEVRCSLCDAHLGDLFHDGPEPTGLRYCIDSVALRFVKFA